MEKIASRIGWENEPSTNTPINEENLNKMDIEINTLDDRVILLDTKKADQTTVNGTITNVELNKDTGVFTITRVDGSSSIIESNLAKVVTNFFFDKTTQKLILTLPDGTPQEVDFSAFITDYEFVDTDRITFSISGDGKVSADIKKGSITSEYLEPNYLADIRLESAKAQASEINASTYATKSQSYAVGGTGTRENEDTDNAKYYNEKAQEALSKMQSSQVTGVKGNSETEYRKGEVNLTSENIGAVKIGGDIADNTVAFTSNDAGPDGTPTLMSLEKLTTGEKLSALMNKVSIIANNFRYFLKMLGTNDISKIGDGTVTGGLVSLNDSLSKIDVSHKINISASGFTNGLTITESNNIIYINGYIRFDSTKNINTVIGNHFFDLKNQLHIPAFVYGTGYVGGFGMLILKTNGYINLLAYSSDNIQEVNLNGCGILN